MASPPEAAKPGGDNPSPPASDTLTPPSSPSPPTERSPPPSTTASPPSSTTETPPPPTTDSPPPPTAASPPPPPTTDSPPPPTTASPPPPTTASPPPPTTASPPPPTTALPPPPTTVSPPPPDSSPPPQPSPDSPPPPKASAQSPPPPDKSETPPVSGPPPVFSPPADEGDRHKPPSPAVAHPPPAPPSKPTNGSPRSSPKDNPSPSSSDSKELPVILGIIFGGLVALILVFVILEWWNRRRDRQRFYLEHGFSFKGGDQYHKGPKQNKTGDPNNKFPLSLGVVGYPIANSDFSSGQYAMHVQSPLAANKVVGSFGAKCEFSYEALAAATDDFCQANLLGQGGFGFVHKGILPDGTKVAVKSLKAGSGQGEREFQAEVEIISRVHHRYLVSLVGYCIAGRQRMLVYEFVPNKTLEFHLHGKDQPVMSWAARRRIAVGSAKGLAYLHEDCYPRIIHRDIKAANILLDFNFEAKVADFGLAKLTSDNYTHVSTRVMGTFGYLAPEYAASGKLTEKSDVFSFGIMLLELITGRRPIDPTNIMEDSLVDWARPLMAKALETGDYSELVDPRLEDKYVPHEMSRMIACAAASIRHSARKRPRMSQIVRALDGNSSLDDLNEGVKPGESTAYNPYDTHAYNADILKFRKMVMSSEDFNSEATTDSGLNQSQGSSGSDSREIGITSLNQKP